MREDDPDTDSRQPSPSFDSLTSIDTSVLLADSAYDQLKRAILRNELQAGTSLSVPRIASRLGVSRSPTREAVQRLVSEGLADYRGRRGAVVSSITLHDLLSLLELREVAEAFAARLAAERGTDEEREAIAKIHDEFCKLDPDAHRGSVAEADLEFHRAIRVMTRNAEVDTALARLQTRGHLSMFQLWAGERNIRKDQSEHAAICKAIIGQDPGSAEDAARTHIANVRQRLLEDLDESQESSPLSQMETHRIT